MRKVEDRFSRNLAREGAFREPFLGDALDAGERRAPGTGGAVAGGRLARAISECIVPGLVAAARSRERPKVLGADVVRFARLLMQGEDAAARGMVGELRRRGIAVEDVRADLLGPAAVLFGTLWEQDVCDFVTVSLGAGKIQEILRDCRSRPRDRAPGPRRRILLATVPGEQHVLGPLMIAEEFRAAGWDVLCCGGASHAELIQALARDWVDMVGLSIATDRHLAPLGDVIRALRRVSLNPSLKITLGGAIVARDPGLVARTGADWIATDPGTAVTDAGRRLVDG